MTINSINSVQRPVQSSQRTGNQNNLQSRRAESQHNQPVRQVTRQQGAETRSINQNQRPVNTNPLIYRQRMQQPQKHPIAKKNDNTKETKKGNFSLAMPISTAIALFTIVKLLDQTPQQPADVNLNDATNNDYSPSISETIPASEVSSPIANYVIPNSIITNAEALLEKNPELKENYDALADTMFRLSSELKENGVGLIENRVKELGGGKVSPIDVMKIINIESNGRVYDPNDPTQPLHSYKGCALGPCQLKESAVDYINNYYKLAGTDKELDVYNPYNNIDACILYLRFIAEKNETESPKITAGYYHDGPWAKSFSEAGQGYMRKFADLSLIDEYPELLDYMYLQLTEEGSNY